ncbi:hypothetical protein M422DRAFT_263556 [Sphaerobolus stellatus SS14]|uniref:Uncharacterized protein n=1 Tax=Sphaerobolus stellatus (strain SS14) TaxID=990650 RepID=A0A0C9TVT4_SPHS4|nr:hypothetical protein M422DRAFT_263556 [Sphaerobolus stellatus SS14]
MPKITFEGIRGKEARAELLKDLRDVLGRLLHAGTAEDFETHWEFMQTEYGNHPAWIKYLEDEYMKHKEWRSQAWRLHAHYGIDVDNYIEKRLVFEEAERRIKELENNQLKAESFSNDETPPLLQNPAQLNSLVRPVLQILGEYLFQYDQSLNTLDPAHSPTPIYFTFTLNRSLCEWTALRVWQDVPYISDDESIPGPANFAIIRLAL